MSYTKWSRQIRDFIKFKCVDGMELSKAMDWALAQGRIQSLDDAKVFPQHLGYNGNNALKQLMLFMQNWTDGSAEQTITYNVHNGLDAWRKLYHDQLPATNHQK